ncbi:MAG: hypothetical protein ACI4GW_12320 [Lachnospiraceae bacterium]
MEFTLLLEQAINKIQNLREYYEHQLVSIYDHLDEELETYKYGVLLEKYFFSKSVNLEIELSEEELEEINQIVEACEVEDRSDGVVVRYKLKDLDEKYKKYELNPQKAMTEYIKLSEQPTILSESTLMMLLVRYEEAIAGIFKYILMEYPDAYLKEKSITYSELMTLNTDIKEVKRCFIEKEVDEFMRLPISDWYNLFAQKHKTKFIFENGEFERFKEIYYRRNLVVHNQGKVNDIYIKNVDECAIESVERGDVLEVSREYMFKAFDLTQLILYGTFWGLKKLSKDKEELEKRMFDMAFKHMENGEWLISEYAYKIMMDEKGQSDADKFCNKVNYWISVKNQGRFEDIKEEIDGCDVSAMCEQFKVAKYALLDEHAKVSSVLEKIIGTEMPSCYIEQWPLFIQYRKSEEYKTFRDKHREEFEELGYVPDYLTVSSEEEIVDEYGNDMEILE